MKEKNENIRSATLSALQTFIIAVTVSEVYHDRMDDEMDFEVMSSSTPEFKRLRSKV